MGFAFGEARPLVTALAVHLPFTDKIGSCRLIRPVDDVDRDADILTLKRLS